MTTTPQEPEPQPEVVPSGDPGNPIETPGPGEDPGSDPEPEVAPGLSPTSPVRPTGGAKGSLEGQHFP